MATAYYHGSPIDVFLRDGIKPEHANKLFSVMNSGNFAYGMVYQIAERNCIFQYTFEGRGASGWKLTNIEKLYDAGYYMTGVDTASANDLSSHHMYIHDGMTIRPYPSSYTPQEVRIGGKPKSTKKQPKQIRHKYLRNVLRDRVKK